MSKKTNELKLIRNARNIAKNYMKINDSLLEAIINEDKDKFNIIATEQSMNNFLGGIVDQYKLFTDELINVIQEENGARITQLMREKEAEKKRFKTVITPKRKAKVKPTLQKPGKLKSKKGKYNKWSKPEENRVKTLIKAGKSNKEIRNELNINRINNNQILRTSSSVNTKIYRLRKQN